MPGMISLSNRNIHLALFSRFASQAWQMVSYDGVWWTENIYSELHRPGLSSRIGDKPKFLGPFGYSYRLAIDLKKQGCFLCKKRTWTFTKSKCLKCTFKIREPLETIHLRCRYFIRDGGVKNCRQIVIKSCQWERGRVKNCKNLTTS